jgi:asparagine synthase (glutamine-hydrolysing)
LPWDKRYAEDVSLQPIFRELRLLSEDVLARAEQDDPLNALHHYLERAPAKDPLSRLLYLDSKTYLPGDILTKVDRMSMLTSLEVRVPILDHVFLEWATSLTPEWKMRGGKQKYMLKKLAQRVGVPREVLDRPKQGFALPLVHWTRHDLKDMIMSVLLEPRTLQRGYFKPEAVRQLLDEHFRQRRNHSGRIWRLLAFELWHRNYLEAIPRHETGIPLAAAVSTPGEAV